MTRLAADYGDRAVTTRAIREGHSHGEGLADAALPDVVVFPQTNEEVAAIVSLCYAARVPVIAFGVGTSLEGHVAALSGGVCVDLSQMDRVLEINAEDLDCRVQAGVTREQVNAELKGTGLFFPIDPGANATIGGMTATRASGTNAVRYGTMRENVLGLTVVTQRRADHPHRRPRAEIERRLRPDAALRRFRRHARHHHRDSAAPLRGTRSDGGGGLPVPGSRECDVDTVITAMQCGIPVARIELLDDVQMRACIRYSKLEGFAEKPTLFFEFHGSETGVAEQAAQMQAIAEEHGGSAFEWATKPEDRSRLWKARHAAYYAAMALVPGTQGFATDACVPISRLADCILETKADVEASGLVAPIVGHVGDGNFHLVVLFDPNDPEQRAKAEALAERVSMRAIAMGGTCTGEHGIGVHKLGALVVEHGDAVDLMRTIKRALDPHGIMNPGKTVPN